MKREGGRKGARNARNARKDFVAKRAALANNERCTESGFGPGLGPSWPRWYAAVCLTIQ